jgi:hypothetical protein
MEMTFNSSKLKADWMSLASFFSKILSVVKLLMKRIMSFSELINIFFLGLTIGRKK